MRWFLGLWLVSIGLASCSAFVWNQGACCQRHRVSFLACSSSSEGQVPDPFVVAMETVGFTEKQQAYTLAQLENVGLYDQDDGSQTLLLLSKDFGRRPELISSMLISDFQLPALAAHQARTAVLQVFREQGRVNGQGDDDRSDDEEPVEAATSSLEVVSSTVSDEVSPNGLAAAPNGSTDKDGDIPPARPLYKAVVVNEHAKRRPTDDYGLPQNYVSRYPKLAVELDEFMTFMTQPSSYAQENPIRRATATVYLKHAKLFLGWYLKEFSSDSTSDLSLRTVISNAEKESAEPILQFLLWLRNTRNIAISYEANLLRGLIKLLKFRFSRESQADPAYGQRSFEDVAVIREIRKWHRDAHRKQSVAPRSSDESQKWISWPEYLNAVHRSYEHVQELMDESSEQANPPPKKGEEYSALERRIAVAFQKYLVLAIFANVPDRQRTIRELELNRSLVKNDNGCWCIKHRPDDYKTGKTYGERPPLQLSAKLTPAIDEFLDRWRPCLLPKTDKVFVQPRTGNGMTRDSVYQVVARSCYQYTGKRTNPHLLRDMIVTHVRESSNASEQELEALALYMGHSVQMQRASYDRRTLNQKVAPAIELMESVNEASPPPSD